MVNGRLFKSYRLFAFDLNTKEDSLRYLDEKIPSSKDFRYEATKIISNEGSTYFFCIKGSSTNRLWIEFSVIRFEIDTRYSGYLKLMQQKYKQHRLLPRLLHSTTATPFINHSPLLPF